MRNLYGLCAAQSGSLWQHVQGTKNADCQRSYAIIVVNIKYSFRGVFLIVDVVGAKRRGREATGPMMAYEVLLCHLLSLLRQITCSFAGPLKLQIARVLAVLLVVCFAIF